MVVKKPIEHPNPTVSVVIPTIPENDYRLVDTLQSQTVDDYEVVVVSDNSLDICEARNLGIQRAEGSIIANTDDDCRPPKTWIESIQETFHSNPDLVLLGGCLDKHSSGPHQYIGANTSYRRSEAIEIGGFDTEFAGWRDDTDFGFRMEIEYGEDRCMFDPNLEVEHIGPLRTTVDRELEQKFRIKYPIRYYKYLYCPDIPFGKVVASLVGYSYKISPVPAEYIIIHLREYLS